MSLLEVNKITPQSGTTLTLGDTGDTINFGSGVLPNFENLTVTGDLTVDTNSLYVDSTNNFVGIGTASPSVALDVVGAITATGNITGTLATASQPNITSVGTLTSATISGNLTVDTNTLLVDSSNNRVGIGISSPIALLTVGGIQETGTDRASIAVKTISNSLSIGESAIQIEEQSGTEGYFMGVDSTGGLFFSNSGSATKTLYLGDDDNVGIGVAPTFTPGGSRKLLQVTNGSNGGLVSLSNDSNESNNPRVFGSSADLGFATGASGSGVIKFFTNTTERMRIDSSGNVGIGVVPQTWYTQIDALQIGLAGSLAANTVNPSRTYLGANVFVNGSNQETYIATDEASQYFQNAGTHIFKVASSGTAGTAISFTEAMKIDNSGNVIATQGSLNLVGTNTQIFAASNGDDIQFKFAGTTRASINNGGRVAAGDGSNAAPGIRFYNDANTGFVRPGSDSIATITGGSERMRINSSGNVGIGTSSPQKLLHVSGGGTTPTLTTGDVIVAQNNANTSDDCKITLIAGTSGNSRITFGDADDSDVGKIKYNHSNNDMMFDTNNQERMRITSSGTVGIGENTPDTMLHVKKASSGTETAFTDSVITLENSGNCRLQFLSGNTSECEIMFGDGNLNRQGRITYNHSDDSLRLQTTNAERMRLTSSGDLVMGKTDPAFNNTAGVAIRNFNAIQVERANACLDLNRMNTNGDIVIFYRGATNVVGSISGSGSSVSYNTSSDYRLKENVVDIPNATERLKQLSPKRFNFIADADITVDGFLAHEVSDIVPEAITGTKDEVDADGNPVYQGIDQSKLVPLLVATIKELEARIEALENA